MAKQNITVRELVDKVKNRELALPEMQRRYVWKDLMVRDLLDSLYRGYPSGAILVWESDLAIEDRSLQVHGVKDKSVLSRLLLLDGQQRLTSLTAILTGEPIMVRNKRKPIDILFNLDHPESISEDSDDKDDDLDEEEDEEELTDEEEEGYDETDIMTEMRKRTFVVAHRSLKNDPTWISVSDVFNKKVTESTLLKPLKINSDHPDWDKYSDRIKKLKKIEDYTYVMDILEKTYSYEEVTEIFVRVNKNGAKLRGSDLALAQITSKWKGFIKEIDSFAKEFGKNEDYLINSGILVKTLVVFATGQSRYKTVNRVTIDDFKEAWKKTQTSLRFAVNLLKNNAAIENLGLLSSPFLLVPISYYVYKKKEKLSTDEETKLMYWFYMAHMKGRYGYGSSEGLLDSDINALSTQGSSLDALLDILKQQVKSFWVTVDDIRGKNRRSPYFSMLFLVAKNKGAKDWATGQKINEKIVGKIHALQFHHIFPKSLLRNLGFDQKQVNEIANLAFIGGKTNRQISNKPPDQYLPEVVATRGQGVLSDHLIPADKKYWSLDKFEEFATFRRVLLAGSLNNFLFEKAGNLHQQHAIISQ